MTVITAIEWTKEYELRSFDKSIDKSIEAGLNYTDQAYDDIISLAKCRMAFVD